MKNFKTAIIIGYLREENLKILEECLNSLENQSYKNFEIFIYDNSTNPDSLINIKTKFSKVHIKSNLKNLGFAGGNNSIIRELLKDKNYKYIVLLNDDTYAEKDWLDNLVKSAEVNQNRGAIASKLIFYEPYIRVNIKSNIELFWGVNSGFKVSNYDKKFYRKGFHWIKEIKDQKYIVSKDNLILDLPIGVSEAQEYELILNLISQQKSEIELDINNFKTKIKLEDLNENQEFHIKIPKEVIINYKFNLIQNASSAITSGFEGYDIGNIQKPHTLTSEPEIDKGQYDVEKDAVMFCGGAVLLRSETLKQVGIFDEYYFVYYEDSDLSLRMRRAGWKIHYQPSAVVRHIHTASSREFSNFFFYHVTKNKLAFVLKNFNIRPNIFMLKQIFKTLINNVLQITTVKFSNKHMIEHFKIYLKAILFFLINIPIIILKRFYFIRSS